MRWEEYSRNEGVCYRPIVGSPVSIRFSPQGLFITSDLSSINRSLKGRSDGEHVLITAGDCLTNTDYTRLIAEHEQGHTDLTIAIRRIPGDRVFTQDAIASRSFLLEAARNSAQNLSDYPHSSPLTAAIHAAWHNHELLPVEMTTEHLNMNTICDYATLISEPARFVPISSIGQPRLRDVTPCARSQSPHLRP